MKIAPPYWIVVSIVIATPLGCHRALPVIEAWDAAVPGDETIVDTEGCAGRPDFSRCVEVTTPDFDYDICVGGECISPGSCGEPACNVPGPFFPLADTNLRTCFNDTERIVCPASESDVHFGQDAQHGWDTVYHAEERFVREVTAEEPVVTDTVTGLMWQGCQAGSRGSNCREDGNAKIRWADALAYCEESEWGGFEDWRLPDEYALQSIIDYSHTVPAIDTIIFPQTGPYYFWSSSSVFDTSTQVDLARCVDFGQGRVLSYPKAHDYRVRCVRDASGGEEGATAMDHPYEARFEKINSETIPMIADRWTGLVWQACVAESTGEECIDASEQRTYTWQQALSYCDALTIGDAEGWRLPNIKELRSIVDTRRKRPCIDTTVFAATPFELFWSSTTLVEEASSAFSIEFLGGNINSTGKDEAMYVRCVRDGGDGDFDEF